MQVVWFKRDLRVQDHAVLVQASRAGVILPLYILEPELWAQPDMSARHYEFLLECLQELDHDLTKLGQSLVVRVGQAQDVLDQIHRSYGIKALWSHQETWNGWTYRRDQQVLSWIRTKGIIWHELPQTGVIRRLKSRNGWAAKWHRQMTSPLLQPPSCLKKIDLMSDQLPTREELHLETETCTGRQKGGRARGLRLLNTFLHERGEGYTKAMSSPLSGFESCSRISPYLAFGVISMREVLQATEARTREIYSLPAGQRGKWPGAMRSFSGRLRWHCHFMQKLEDEPRIEFENLHSAYNGLREGDFNQSYFSAWKEGKTGYPMIDACMRALIDTGWLNFRMRAMLMSFAAYHLWLHWREPALHLARLFLDYEPGIHYSQVQMQSGTTGINSIRIYNPIKQGIDHDPNGHFVRQWIPELRDVPSALIHTPWLMPEAVDGYPMPIVDEKQARQRAADRLHTLRKALEHQPEAEKIVRRHGSRKSGIAPTVPKGKPKSRRIDDTQMDLPF